MPEALSMTRIQSLPRQRAVVLVIDEDATIRALVKLHLVNSGYEVLEAADVVEGGHLAIGKSPDLIVCEASLPYMDGYEFVAAVKSDPLTRHIPVVFLTADEEVAGKAERVGAAAYLGKPVKADRLLEVVGLFASQTAPASSISAP